MDCHPAVETVSTVKLPVENYPYLWNFPLPRGKLSVTRQPESVASLTQGLTASLASHHGEKKKKNYETDVYARTS